jgi:hypothetical protein
MMQQTLTDHDPVAQATEWCVRDSVAAAYNEFNDHLARFDEYNALTFWVDGEIPESERL